MMIMELLLPSPMIYLIMLVFLKIVRLLVEIFAEHYKENLSHQRNSISRFTNIILVLLKPLRLLVKR